MAFRSVRNPFVRSHKSHALLHRIDNNQGRILGSSMRESILLPDRLVQSTGGRVRPDGRGHPTYVSR